MIVRSSDTSSNGPVDFLRLQKGNHDDENEIGSFEYFLGHAVLLFLSEERVACGERFGKD